MNLLSLLKPKGDIEYIHCGDTLRQGLERMRIYGYTAIPVIDNDGHYAGTVTEGDFLWFVMQHKQCEVHYLENFKVNDILRREFMPPVYVYATMKELLERASNQNFVPVIDDRDVFIGIVTRRDIINSFAGSLAQGEVPPSRSNV